MEKESPRYGNRKNRERLCYNAHTGTREPDMVVRPFLERTAPHRSYGLREVETARMGNFLEVITMVKQVKVSNFTEVKGIVSAAAKCYNAVGVHDMKGSIADAKSILGMMSLDYSHPVKIVCEDERDLSRVVNAIKQ